MTKIVKHTHLTLALRSIERAAVRAEMFQHWIAENPGSQTQRNTYRYDVETLADGSKIYLTRPTRLNKGADFVIFCENFIRYKNGNAKPPRHEDIFSETDALTSPSKAHKAELLAALHKIWNCENSQNVIQSLRLHRNDFKAHRVLLLAKWFFIEQDVTYWTESGRHMLRDAFEERFGPWS